MPANNCTITAAWTANSNTLQNYTASKCSSSAASAAQTLTDARDGKTYTVRYINGLCTMTKNLDFELVTGIELSAASTHVGSTTTMGAVSPLLGSSASYTAPQVQTSTTAGYGTNYNYCAATASEICTSSNSAEATQDICPKGWRLPTGDSTSGEQKLITNGWWQTYDKTYLDAFSPVAAGSYTDGKFYSGSGNWWSSTASSNSRRYRLYYLSDNAGLRSGADAYKNTGYSVRCVLK